MINEEALKRFLELVCVNILDKQNINSLCEELTKIFCEEEDEDDPNIFSDLKAFLFQKGFDELEEIVRDNSKSFGVSHKARRIYFMKGCEVSYEWSNNKDKYTSATTVISDYCSRFELGGIDAGTAGDYAERINNNKKDIFTRGFYWGEKVAFDVRKKTYQNE